MNTVVAFPKKKKPSPWTHFLNSKGKKVPGFYVYRASGVIYYRKKFGKKSGVPLLFRPTGETTIGRAKERAEAMLQDWIMKHTGRAPEEAKREQKLVRDVIKDLRENYSPKQRAATRRKHVRYLGEIEARFGRYPLPISQQLFELWISELRKTSTYKRGNRTYVRNTYDGYVKHMNLVSSWAQKRGMTPYLVKYESIDGKRPNIGRVYTTAEIKALWEVMNEDTRDQFVLSYECMMREREVLHLEWNRVDLKTGKITLRAEDVKTGSKTGKGREFLVSPHALDRLQARRERDPKSRWVFPSPVGDQPVDEIKRAWATAKRNAGIKARARWHDLRHTAISDALLIHGIEPIKVSEYAGVRLETLQRVYLHSKAHQTRDAGRAVSVLPKRGKKGVKRHG